MRRLALPMLLAPALVVGCASEPTKGTLAELHNVKPDLQEATVEQGLDQAMLGYRRFLEETPQTQMTPEAMRRLADLQIEKQFGLKAGDGKPREMAAPGFTQISSVLQAERPDPAATAASTGTPESEVDFERRTTALEAVQRARSPSSATTSGSGVSAEPPASSADCSRWTASR